MILVVIPLIIMILSIATVWVMDDPSWLAYTIATLINLVMVFLMVKAYLMYIKTFHELRDKEFVEDINAMSKKIYDNSDSFSQEEIKLQLENINNMINEYNEVHQKIVVAPIDIEQFLKHSSKE